VDRREMVRISRKEGGLMTKTKQLNLRNCPAPVHLVLKIMAAKERKSLQDLVVEILKQYLKDK